MLPRDAYFSRKEEVPIHEAIGRVSAETVSTYPPGAAIPSWSRSCSQEFPFCFWLSSTQGVVEVLRALCNPTPVFGLTPI